MAVSINILNTRVGLKNYCVDKNPLLKKTK